ncbi:MAG: SUMF1/EgtB/PvdO family nonheme iron enzyme [Immundisolibacteraceae bacterium]|nr:SUMF1/EgtB/PvdO family nonheme iron enzyme [Immundisolibacteraceae bacterium]
MSELVKIPGYIIDSVLGYGGMSTVYLAEQESLGRRVALKVMSESLSHDPTYTKRFLKEARIIAQLNYPYIIVIYDYGVVDSQHYIAMECVDGGDLFRRVKKGIGVPETLDVMYQMAKALSYAHGKGYIHRDIKPGNILFREDGTVVLSDFGLAKGLTDNTQVTAAGMTLGTPAYMSPEQSFGEQLDSRSDLYSLGCVFYFMLTQEKPYTADNPVALAMKHLRDPIPRLPDAVSWLQPVLDQLMAKKPADRFQYGEDLAKVIQQYRDEDSVTPIKPSLVQNMKEEEAPGELELEDYESFTSLEVAKAVDEFSNDALKSSVRPAINLSLVSDEHLSVDDEAPSMGGFTEQVAQAANKPQAIDSRAYLQQKMQDSQSEIAVAQVDQVDHSVEPSGSSVHESASPDRAPPKVRDRSHGEVAAARGGKSGQKQKPPRLLIASIGAAIVITVVNVGAGLYLASQRNVPEISKVEEKVQLDESRWTTPVKKLITFSDPLSSGGTGPKMVVITKGSFQMGDVSGRYGPSARPVRTVHLARDFAIGTHEVTFEQYDKFATETGRPLPEDRHWGRQNRPVIYVSWQDASDYVAWLSQQTGKKYRLPAEAEWEFASRAGTQSDFWWGEWPNHDFANFGSEVCCRGKIAGADQWAEETNEVGAFPANDFGLHDSLGNVWEWVQDCWNVDHYGGPSSGSVRQDGDCRKRVVRGGSWSDIPRNVGVAARGRAAVDKKLAFIGFRVVREQ